MSGRTSGSSAISTSGSPRKPIGDEPGEVGRYLSPPGPIAPITSAARPASPSTRSTPFQAWQSTEARAQVSLTSWPNAGSIRRSAKMTARSLIGRSSDSRANYLSRWRTALLLAGRRQDAVLKCRLSAADEDTSTA